MRRELYLICSILLLVFLTPAIIAYSIPASLHVLKFLGCHCNNIPSPTNYFDPSLWVKLSGLSTIILMGFFLGLLKVKSEHGLYFTFISATISILAILLYVVFGVLGSTGSGISRGIETIAISLVSVVLEVGVISSIFFEVLE